MKKAFDNFTWKNLPSTETPINATNLNKINNGLNTVDDRVIDLDTNKASKDIVLEKLNQIIKGDDGPTTITFQDNVIVTTKRIYPWTTVDGLDWSSMTTTDGQCVLVFPKQESQLTGVGIRLYICES